MLRKITHKVGHVHIHVITLVLCFWILQLIAWLGMMTYVQFFPNKLKNSILYTIQISHWALVITCGTAATATWGLINARVQHIAAMKVEAQERAEMKELEN